MQTEWYETLYNCQKDKLHICCVLYTECHVHLGFDILQILTCYKYLKFNCWST